MPPEPVEFRGPLAITGFLESHLGGQELKLVSTRANHQPALALYLADPCAPIWRACSLAVLTLRGNRVCAITRFGEAGTPRPLRASPHAAKRLMNSGLDTGWPGHFAASQRGRPPSAVRMAAVDHMPGPLAEIHDPGRPAPRVQQYAGDAHRWREQVRRHPVGQRAEAVVGRNQVPVPVDTTAG
jgi:hypothetical protein